MTRLLSRLTAWAVPASSLSWTDLDGRTFVERHHWTIHADHPCWCGAWHTLRGARRANRDTQLYRSTDNGATWERLP